MDRETVLYGKFRVWSEDGPEHGVEAECWGEPTDLASAVLSAFEDDDVTGIVISLTRGAPDDQPLAPRESDPRDG